MEGASAIMNATFQGWTHDSLFVSWIAFAMSSGASPPPAALRFPRNSLKLSMDVTKSRTSHPPRIFNVPIAHDCQSQIHVLVCGSEMVNNTLDRVFHQQNVRWHQSSAINNKCHVNTLSKLNSMQSAANVFLLHRELDVSHLAPCRWPEKLHFSVLLDCFGLFDVCFQSTELRIQWD